MEMNQDLQGYQFHATWDLKRNLVKSFDILMRQIDEHITDETHDTFREEGLLFKSYLYMSGIGGNSNKDKKKANECLNEAITLLDKWDKSPEKDGFLSIAYALDAWINDVEKTDTRLQDLDNLSFHNRHENKKPFEATIHYIKGYSLSRLGVNRYAECIEEFRQAKEKSPENYEYLFSFVLMTRRFNGPDVGEEVKEKLLKVLEKKNDYLYAKVELAYYLMNLEGNEDEATELLEQITTLITTKLKDQKSITPENMKILGHVMKIYLKMGKDVKTEETYNMACGSGQEPNSFVLHQRAMLAKKKEKWGDYKTFLERALKRNTFHLFVKLQLAKQKLHKGNTGIDDVNTEFDKMINEHSGDEIAVIRIRSDFGTMLREKKDKKRAVPQYKAAIDTACQYFQRDPDKKTERIKFYYDVNFSVQICVMNLREYWKNDIKQQDDIKNNENDIKKQEAICNLAKLEYKLRNFYLTRSYCKDALEMELDEKQRSEIDCILTEIEIELSMDVDSLAKVDEMLKKITPSEKSNQKIKELRRKLTFKSGILHERFDNTAAVKKYVDVAESGHVEAIKRLLTALEIMDKTSSKFYEMCAFIDMSIMNIQADAVRDNMQGMLKRVLETAISGDLKRLREQQFEMEKALRSKSGATLYNAATVMRTSRSLLNYAMYGLDQRYRQPKPNAENTIDFFCIRKNFDKKQTESKVILKLQPKGAISKWEDIDKELIKFLVEIQPCTNPKAYNWIMAFMDFDNTEKHARENKQYVKYKVYPEDHGANRGVYQDKEYNSVDLARTVCNNISYILDNLNGFSVKF